MKYSLIFLFAFFIICEDVLENVLRKNAHFSLYKMLRKLTWFVDEDIVDDVVDVVVFVVADPGGFDPVVVAGDRQRGVVILPHSRPEYSRIFTCTSCRSLLLYCQGKLRILTGACM